MVPIAFPKADGVRSFCAPRSVRNKELTAKLGSALNRPAFMTAPAFMIKLLLGEFGETLLNRQRVVPEKLENSCAFQIDVKFF